MLEPGQILARYRLVEKIGEGGMGVVWRARDEKLRRDVALKVLPPELAADPERRRRLIHEARAEAAVSHPSIAAVHDVDEVDGQVFFAMELVEGIPLRSRLLTPLSLNEALRFATEIAEGLASAHAAKLVHRDLKPENVMVRPDGHVKILDFGLAKVREEREELSRSRLSRAETLTDELTREGRVLGTAPYMSPEQARGETLDSRADIFSFGSMLYEMVAGQAPFEGRTATDILSSVLRDRPPAPSSLDPGLPAEIDRIVGKCLEKEPRDRYQHADELAVDLRKLRRAVETGTPRSATPSGGILAPTTEAATAPVPRRARPAWPLAAAAAAIAVTGAVVGIAAWQLLRAPAATAPGAAPVVRFSLGMPEGMDGPPFAVTLSPDGSHLAFMVTDPSVEDADRRHRLYLHSLDRGSAEMVQGSAGLVPYHFAFSPDGRWLAFVALAPPPATTSWVYKVPVDGSAPPVTVVEKPEGLVAGWVDLVWPRLEEIVCLVDGYGVFEKRAKLIRIPAGGGPPGPPVKVVPGGLEVDFFNIRPLPGGAHLLANVWPATHGGVAVVDIETGKAQVIRESRWDSPRWSPTGHILLERDGALLALPFDLERLQVTGGPTAVAEGIGSYWVSDTGTLAYRPHVPRPEWYLASVDREGRVERWPEEGVARLLPHVEVSADGRMMAVRVGNPDTTMYEIWGTELERPRLRPLVRVADRDCHSPRLSFDGEHLLTYCYSEVGFHEDEGLYLVRTDGAGERLLLAADDERSRVEAGTFTPDGKWIACARHYPEEKRREYFLLPMEPDAGGVRRPRPLDALLGDVGFFPPVGRFSPDGRWIAYTSERSGRPQVYLRRFGDDLSPGPEIPVSREGGHRPLWRRDRADGSLELVYFTTGNPNGFGPGTWMAVPVGDDPPVPEPRPILDRGQKPYLNLAAMLPDGRFLAVLVEEHEETEKLPAIQVVVNWTEELKQRLSATR